MSNLDLAGVVQELRNAESFLLVTHASPDGDAVGCVLALKHFLHALGKEKVVCACQDPVPRIYDWLPGSVEIVDRDNAAGDYDLVVIVDVAELVRVGSLADVIGPEQRTLVIDHHREDNPCGTVNFVDPTYAAASEIIVYLFREAGVPMSREAAECAYVGLTTDTGGFRYGNTNARAHESARILIESGVDVAQISARVFEIMSLPKYALLRLVLDRTIISDGGRYAHSFLTEEDMVTTDGLSEDADGLVNYTRNIEGVEVGILFRQVKPKRTKLSIRSRAGFDSSAFAKLFGGGGHAGAAGAVVHQPLRETRELVIGKLADTLESTDA